MQIRYYVDPETEAPHIYNHGVLEREIEEVFARPGEDRPGRDGSRITIGRPEIAPAFLAFPPSMVGTLSPDAL